MMTVFFTSDTHFGDHRTINIYGRPFRSVSEMDAVMIANWNSTVGVDDDVWHLGDFARRGQDAPDLLARINGHKHLVRGNNDPPGTLEASGWTSVGDYAELEIDGLRLILCHYPFRSWNGQYRGSINLHGHSHGRMKPLSRQYDVGVDAMGFHPVQVMELFSRAALPTEVPPL
jgi:calcineurin-like phosphoesterase family protein